MGTLGRRWSKLDLDEAQRLYDSGLSFAQVAQRLDTTKSYLAFRFRRDGLPRRPSGRPLTSPAPAVDLDDLVSRRDQGQSYVTIARDLGISTDMARDRYLQAKGRPRRARRSSDRCHPDQAPHRVQ